MCVFTLDCGDNSCQFVSRPATGQRTNSGCRCLETIYGSKRQALLVREAQRINLIDAIAEVRRQLQQNVFETGQPGTWATKLDDQLAELLRGIKIATGTQPKTPPTDEES